MWDKGKTWLHTIYKICTRIAPVPKMAISEAGYSYFNQLGIVKWWGLTLCAGDSILLSTILYTLTLQAGVNNYPILFINPDNRLFDDLLNTVEGEILETEIEIDDLFADEESNLILVSNQQLNSSHLSN